MSDISEREANQHTYRGNSISYIHTKMQAYKTGLGKKDETIATLTAKLDKAEKKYQELKTYGLEYQLKDEITLRQCIAKERDELQAKLARCEEAIKGALAIKKLWLYPSSKTVTIQQRTEGSALRIMQKRFEQALKEQSNED